MCSKCTHTQAIEDVDEFVSLLEQIFETFNMTSLTNA